MTPAESIARCPALLIAAPASGQGKTTITAALAHHYRERGLRVRVFKTGPDFLDPLILEQASGAPVYQLDLWMGGEDHCRALLHQAARTADLILVEGVMGLFDGDPSSADLAMRFGIPVLAVIDGGAMAQTFGAIAHGLSTYRDGLPFAGVFANRVAGEQHYRMLVESLPAGMQAHGWLARDAQIALPERHLGLQHAAEIFDLDARIARAAAALQNQGAALPPAVGFTPGVDTPRSAWLGSTRIAVARDAAFSFIYRANLELLADLGARLSFFSPLYDTTLPEVDALYLPGGYPELYLTQLSANHAMRESVRAHHAHGKPIVAECGGMLYLSQSLTDADGRRMPMAGLIPGEATMQHRLANIGLYSLDLPEGRVRGHTFHHSRMESELEPIAWTEGARQGARAEPAYRSGRLHASYLHIYMPSNPLAVARLFGAQPAPSSPAALTPSATRNRDTML